MDTPQVDAARANVNGRLEFRGVPTEQTLLERLAAVASTDDG